MNKKDISPINPFQNLLPPKYLTKNRDCTSNNPFHFPKIDSGESSFTAIIKLKTKSKNHHGFNPFLNKCEEKEEKAPFYKGEQNIHAVFKGLNKNNNRSNITNLLTREKQMVVKPKINIYICENDFFNNKPFEDENINCHFQTDIKEKKYQADNSNIIFSQDKKEDEEVDITESLCAPAPAIDPIVDISNKFEKLTLEEMEKRKMIKEKDLWKHKQQISEEKIYTNDGNCTIGQYYIE